MITLTYHPAHRACRPGSHPQRNRMDPAELARGTHSTARLLHGSVCAWTSSPPSSTTMSKTTKGLTVAFREDWTGSWASQHWAVLRQVSLLSGSADVRWKASGHLSDVLFTERKHQGLLTNGNSLSPKLPRAATTSFFCLKGCTHD